MSFDRWEPDIARGRWPGILRQIGMGEEYLRNKHGPCPFCQAGVDRYRFDDKNGDGTSICGQCGARSGLKMVQDFLGCDFLTAKDRVKEILGQGVPKSQAKPQMSEARRREYLRDVWKATTRAAPGDLVHRYLEARGVGELVYPDALRFAPKLADGDGGLRPCMVAMVSGPDGKPVTMHRTFLAPDGSGKAEMASPRKIMPGELPDGACVRLGEYVPGGPLGVAEGIETALSASALWDLPVWATISTAMMKRWLPPDGCKEVAIFADNDAKFGGLAAAYALAHRLACAGLSVTVHAPPLRGDWNDHLQKRLRKDLD